MRKKALIVGALVVALGATGYLAYGFRPTSAEDRPTLMFFWSEQ